MRQLTEDALSSSREGSSFIPPTEIFLIVKRNDQHVEFEEDKIRRCLARACVGFEDDVDQKLILNQFKQTLFTGVSSKDLEQSLIMAAAAFVGRDWLYSKVAARLLLQKICKEVFAYSVTDSSRDKAYRQAFIDGIQHGVENEFLDKRLLEYDLAALAQVLCLERDEKFEYMGLRTLYGRYLLKVHKKRIEVPQAFWMRVAMGLALGERDKQERAVDFYHLLSKLRYVASTPTLFHAGTTHPQLSSCYINTINDDLRHIFKSLGDNAQLSKWSGGVSTDCTNIRATGSLIKSIDIPSQGVIPFLKLAGDVTAAINRSGSRRGATVVYLETWHLDIEDFLDLRRNTGDERRRTHDLNTAHWIPDIFMQRVEENGTWTLFSPDHVSDLHHLYGKKFQERYEHYERLAEQSMIPMHRTISARALWRKMLTRLFETGHPWITFKDACNIRSPQDHVGVIHSSNLCTEITLNTSAEETAVCNLGSINLSEHIHDGKLDRSRLARTVHTAMRMLDNVIDLNFYPTDEGSVSNQRHRPVGLGLMGFQDALYKLNISFSSEQALVFADESMEFISYHAILASSELAKQRGTYKTYKGSKWDRGIFPIDTLDLLENERGIKVTCPRTSRMDWRPVREHVSKYGMRNSNTMAIAPTATISNIAGNFPCIEPIYKNVYVKSNTDGEFTVVNKYLHSELKQRGLWSEEMCERIKYYDGSIAQIAQIPADLKKKYLVAFELDPEWLMKISAVRGKWIDQAQSHNVFLQGVSGTQLHDIYFTSWRLGLKTNYYLRTMGASQIEKATLDAGKYGFTQKRVYATGKACEADDQSCEACQ